jgi:hypothetical protein
MSVPGILRVWLFSLPDRSRAVQVSPELGDGAVISCYCTILWNSFVFIALKHSHRLKLEFDGMVSVTKIVCNLSSRTCVLRFTNKMSFVFGRLRNIA